jgi:hypothetical protein
VEIITLLIGLFGGFALNFGITTLFKRRFNFLIQSERLEYENKLKEKEQRILYQAQLITSVMHDIHHSSAIVNVQRIRGMISLYRLEGSTLSTRLNRLGKTTWGEAIRIDFKEFDEKYFSIMEQQAQEAEDKLIKSIEPLNKHILNDN